MKGGAIMGLGYGLTEDVVLQEGVIVNPRFSGYLLPTIADAPPITSVILELADPSGPFGAKGMGEAVAVPSAASVANAVSAALGLDIQELPLTPGRLYAIK